MAEPPVPTEVEAATAALILFADRCSMSPALVAALWTPEELSQRPNIWVSVQALRQKIDEIQATSVVDGASRHTYDVRRLAAPLSARVAKLYNPNLFYGVPGTLRIDAVARRVEAFETALRSVVGRSVNQSQATESKPWSRILSSSKPNIVYYEDEFPKLIEELGKVVLAINRRLVEGAEASRRSSLSRSKTDEAIKERGKSACKWLIHDITPDGLITHVLPTVSEAARKLRDAAPEHAVAEAVAAVRVEAVAELTGQLQETQTRWASMFRDRPGYAEALGATSGDSLSDLVAENSVGNIAIDTPNQRSSGNLPGPGGIA